MFLFLRYNALPMLNDLLKMLHQENKTIFITGDFNINTSDSIINPNINVINFHIFIPLLIDNRLE